MNHRDDPPQTPAPADPPPADPVPPPSPRELPIEAFLGEPTRDLAAWHQLWSRDRPFPVESHRGPLGRLVVAVKRLLRPLVRAATADLWDRQRTFNLVLLEHLRDLEARRHEERLGHLENFVPRGLDDLLAHNDALFSRVDQKLDRYRREARELVERLGAALAVAETAGERGEAAANAEGSGRDALAELVRVRDEAAYLELERHYRGTPEEIRQRIEGYRPHLERVAGLGPVLDLGCGRGEALAVLGDAGLTARGVDASAEMVAACRERGLAAARGDLFEALAAEEEGSLGAVVSFHVIEHLPPESLDRLVRLAWRALAPGGVLILETPNPLSVSVAARSFWLDPTHQRPVHPDSLTLSARLAGFEPVERLELRPYPAAERLPELDLAELPEEQHRLADRINRLRDRLDDLLFGYQDYALVAWKPAD